jgi:hypothetical protein
VTGCSKRSTTFLLLLLLLLLPLSAVKFTVCSFTLYWLLFIEPSKFQEGLQESSSSSSDRGNSSSGRRRSSLVISPHRGSTPFVQAPLQVQQYYCNSIAAAMHVPCPCRSLKGPLAVVVHTTSLFSTMRCAEHMMQASASHVPPTHLSVWLFMALSQALQRTSAAAASSPNGTSISHTYLHTNTPQQLAAAADVQCLQL